MTRDSGITICIARLLKPKFVSKYIFSTNRPTFPIFKQSKRLDKWEETRKANSHEIYNIKQKNAFKLSRPRAKKKEKKF